MLCFMDLHLHFCCYHELNHPYTKAKEKNFSYGFKFWVPPIGFPISTNYISNDWKSSDMELSKLKVCLNNMDRKLTK
jgi:hypothetical protein